MIRWLVLLIGSLIAYSLLRSIINMVMSALSGSEGQPEQRRRGPGGTPATPKQQSLIRDPVCGTFVTESSPWVRHKGGETFHFCSEACRDKFAA